MANKNNVTKIPLNGLLNLNKYRNEIKQFEGFNEKNSPIYSDILSPFYKHESDINNDTDVVFANNKEYRLVYGALFDWDYASPTQESILILPKKRLIKKNINVPFKILAFEIDDDNPRYIDMFVEQGTLLIIKRYDTINESFVDYSSMELPSGDFSNISHVEMRHGFVVFYNIIDKEVVILYKNNAYRFETMSWDILSSSRDVLNNLSFTINKLPSSFNYNNKPRYIISACAKKHSYTNVTNILSQNYIIKLGNDNEYTVDSITLKSLEDNNLGINQIPSFALNSNNENNIIFYNTMCKNLDSDYNKLYLTGTPSSYNDTNKILTLTCNNTITPLCSNDNFTIGFNSYFYYMLYVDTTSEGDHVLFDSTHRFFIGNSGYISTEVSNDDVTRNIPYGFKSTVLNGNSNANLFSFLVNYDTITNVSINEDNYEMGTILAEWNTIDNDVLPKVSSTSCVYKISNENTIVLINIENEYPEMKVLFDRYIVFNTPSVQNMFDTYDNSIYHAFIDYNNSYIPCEQWGDTNIQHFPYLPDDTPKYILGGNPQDYLFASSINANMEISKINISSIQYNPIIVNQGSFRTFVTPYPHDENKVDVYISADNRALVPMYYCTIKGNNIYQEESLLNIPYPITSNGNILYSANLFSKIINSYINKDMIINDTVGYPLLYINNQPTLSFYFLNGVENATSAFMIHGLNYINTNNFIFSVSYNGDTINNIESVVSIKGFRFLGNTTEVAYYYSELKKSVYAFYGDRTLTKVYDCTEIQNIKNTYFNPINYGIYIVTDNHIYVIEDNTIYKLEISGTKNMYFDKNFINIVTNNKMYKLSYENVESSYYNFTKIPIKLETQFYGMGNNIKSIIDCIYLRLFNNNIIEQGNLKLKVKTLTDKGEITEEKIFNINASDWDKESNTFYIRYQPKNQECIGMSINLVSDFAIADFDIGYSTDGIIQVSKYNV